MLQLSAQPIARLLRPVINEKESLTSSQHRPVRCRELARFTGLCPVKDIAARRRAEYNPGGFVRRAQPMARFCYTLMLALAAGAASAQPSQDACGRDVVRHCRAVMNNGDQAVLVCLKQNRDRLSKACGKVLTDNGQ
jgi:hypothetical protein